MLSREVRVWVGAVCLVLSLGVSAWAQAPSTAAGTLPQNSGEHSSPLQADHVIPAQAGIPHLIKFSGALHNLAGKPVTGPVDVTFSLYSIETSGAALWFETQTVQADSLGNYTVLLGAMTPAGVPMELFTEGEARWLGVQVTNLPEQPRVLLVSVPYAMKAGDAETLGGKPASAFQLASPCSAGVPTGGSAMGTSPAGGQHSSPLQPNCAAAAAATAGTLSGLITSGELSPMSRTRTTPQAIAAGGAANYIAGYSTDGSTLGASAIYQDPATNRIGIGTNTPSFGLDLNGNAFAVGAKTAQSGYGGTMRFRDDTGTARWLFGIPGSAGSQDFFMYNLVNGHAPLYFQTGAPSYGLYFASSGNVGLKTNAPSFGLDINSNVIGVGTKAPLPGYGGTIRLRDDTGTVRWALGIPGSAGSTDFFMSNLVTSQLPFYIQTATPSNTLYLNSLGRVGIGTAAPAQKLDVAGSVKITGAGNALIFPDGTVMTSAGTGTNGGTITGVAAGVGLVGGGTAGNVSLSLVTGSCPSGQAAVALPLSCQPFASSGQNAFAGNQSIAGNETITGNLTVSGTVGIGTTTPTATLEVQGPPAVNQIPGSAFDGGNGAPGLIVTAQNGADWDTPELEGGGGGPISLTAGNGARSASGGSLKFTGGNGGVGGYGTIYGGNPGGTGGSITLVAGNGGSAWGDHEVPGGSGASITIGGGGGEAFTSVHGIPGSISIMAGSVAGEFVREWGNLDIHAQAVTIQGNSLPPALLPAAQLNVLGDVTIGSKEAPGCLKEWSGQVLAGTCVSDERLKKSIQPFGPSLDRLVELRPVLFNWRAEEFPEYHFSAQQNYGLIAQEAEKAFPEIVSTGHDGYKKVNYSVLPFLLLQGVRELKAQDDTLRRLTIEQQAEIQKLRAEVGRLRKQQAALASLEERLKRLELREGVIRIASGR